MDIPQLCQDFELVLDLKTQILISAELIFHEFLELIYGFIL